MQCPSWEGGEHYNIFASAYPAAACLMSPRRTSSIISRASQHIGTVLDVPICAVWIQIFVSVEAPTRRRWQLFLVRNALQPRVMWSPNDLPGYLPAKLLSMVTDRPLLTNGGALQEVQSSSNTLIQILKEGLDAESPLRTMVIVDYILFTETTFENLVGVNILSLFTKSSWTNSSLTIDEV
jgi:hypothetical protein